MRPLLNSLLIVLGLASTACGTSGITFSQIDRDLGDRPFTLTAQQVAEVSPAPYRDLAVPPGDKPRQIMRCYAPKDLDADQASLCFEFVDGTMFYREAQRVRRADEAMDDFESLRASGEQTLGIAHSIFFIDPDKRCVIIPGPYGKMTPWKAGEVVSEGSAEAERAYDRGELCGHLEWSWRGTPRASVTLRPSSGDQGLYEIIVREYNPDPQLHAQRAEMLKATKP